MKNLLTLLFGALILQGCYNYKFIPHDDVRSTVADIPRIEDGTVWYSADTTVAGASTEALIVAAQVWGYKDLEPFTFKRDYINESAGVCVMQSSFRMKDEMFAFYTMVVRADGEKLRVEISDISFGIHENGRPPLDMKYDYVATEEFIFGRAYIWDKYYTKFKKYKAWVTWSHAYCEAMLETAKAGIIAEYKAQDLSE